MRILVTGGNGYVGRNLCRRLLPKHEICVVDNQRYGPIRLESEELAHIRWEHQDIRDVASMKRVIDRFQPEAIVHLAAIHFIPECESNPSLAVETNELGTVNLASLCPANCRFVFASSGAVYAPCKNPLDEASSPVAPSDVYGWTKLHAENLIRYLSLKRGFPSVIVRLFNVAGPGETNPHILPEIIAQLKCGRTTLQLGNLQAFRDYVHVDDVARGFAIIATSAMDDTSGEPCQVVNLGSGLAYSVQEILDRLRKITKIAFEVESDPNRMRPSDRPYLIANNQRIKHRYDWQPNETLDSTLAHLWDTPDLPESLLNRYR